MVADASRAYFFDVSGDGHLSAADVLQVVNYLNSKLSSAEREFQPDGWEDTLDLLAHDVTTRA